MHCNSKLLTSDFRVDGMFWYIIVCTKLSRINMSLPCVLSAGLYSSAIWTFRSLRKTRGSSLSLAAKQSNT